VEDSLEASPTDGATVASKQKHEAAMRLYM
jgi:hypothetical protein